MKKLKMKRSTNINPFRTTCLATIVFASLLQAGEPLPLPEDTPWNLTQLKKTPGFKWVRQDGDVHSLTYSGEKYRGKPTSVFAYYASPATLGVKTRGKVPGIVLVHGGGGSAFSKWAHIWAKRGYAAIAMDLAGKGEGRKRLADGGPDQGHREKFSTIDEPHENQWTYHAVANVVRGHSLLRSLPGIDADNIVLTGISWGGYLTCIVAGVDDRFKVAMPVYGCGFLRDNSVWTKSEFGKLSGEQSDKWHNLWDPSRYIGSAKMPVMFLNGTNDFAYPMDSYAKTCSLVQTEKNYSIQLRMKHGHIFEFREFFLFVDQYIRSATPMAVVSRPMVKDGTVHAAVKSETRLVSARLHYTTGPHEQNRSRPWTTVDLEVASKKVSGSAPPDNATAWYIDVTDERKALTSSEVMIP
jgi:dienelactone hydrolase